MRIETHASAHDALRFLLNLDTLIYQVTGYKSIEYNGGQHVKHRVNHLEIRWGEIWAEVAPDA